MPNLSTRNATIWILLLLTVLSGVGCFFAFKYAMTAAGIALFSGSFSGAWSSLMLALNASHPSESPTYIQGVSALAPYIPPDPPAPVTPAQPEK